MSDENQIADRAINAPEVLENSEIMALGAYAKRLEVKCEDLKEERDFEFRKNRRIWFDNFLGTAFFVIVGALVIVGAGFGISSIAEYNAQSRLDANQGYEACIKEDKLSRCACAALWKPDTRLYKKDCDD